MTPRSARVRRLRLLAATAIPAVMLLLVLAGGARAEDVTVGQIPFATPSPEPSLIPGPLPPSPLPHPPAGATNQCYECHKAVNHQQETIATAWQASVHGKNGVGCADCHGGDPNSDRMGIAMDRTQGFIGKPSRAQTVGICGSCHADPARMGPYKLSTDQYSKYWTSVHGQRLLAAADTQVAICIDCHGSHDIKKASDPTAAVYPANVPELCSSCHSNATKMGPYGIPTNQYEIYSKSVHGIALLDDSDVRAPSCASCHGSHDAKPPTSTSVVEVCGKCHTATQELYMQSRHSELSTAAPKCWTCHGTHDVAQPSEALFFHPVRPEYQCFTCHDPVDRSLRIQLTQFKNEADRRCDTCHHVDSDIYAQVEAIAGSLSGAKGAFDSASSRIHDAAGVGMTVEDANVALSEAKTSLIKAQAAVHTTKLTIISATAAEAQEQGGERAGDRPGAARRESLPPRGDGRRRGPDRPERPGPASRSASRGAPPCGRRGGRGLGRWERSDSGGAVRRDQAATAPQAPPSRGLSLAPGAWRQGCPPAASPPAVVKIPLALPGTGRLPFSIIDDPALSCGPGSSRVDLTLGSGGLHRLIYEVGR